MHNTPDTYTLCRPMCYVSSMRWYTVLESWESMKGESSQLGLGNTRVFFYFLFSPPTCFFFFFPQEDNKCFPFIIIYYFARYSCIACIMLLKPMLARSPRSFCNYDNKCFLGFFKTIQIRKCSHHKLLT